MINVIAWDKETDTKVIPEREPNNGEWAAWLGSDGKVKYKMCYKITPAAKPIIITSITGALQHKSDFSLTTCYELTDIVVAGTLDIPDRTFALPVKRNDNRLFLFEAAVINGQFSVTLNFPTTGSFSCSDVEVNKDLPTGTFSIDTMQFDVLRKTQE